MFEPWLAWPIKDSNNNSKLHNKLRYIRVLMELQVIPNKAATTSTSWRWSWSHPSQIPGAPVGNQAVPNNARPTTGPGLESSSGSASSLQDIFKREYQEGLTTKDRINDMIHMPISKCWLAQDLFLDFKFMRISRYVGKEFSHQWVRWS
jgi:hypothetical protein